MQSLRKILSILTNRNKKLPFKPIKLNVINEINKLESEFPLNENKAK